MTKSQQKTEKIHKPVLLREVLSTMNVGKNAHLKFSTKKVYIDATLGLGGHSIELIKSGGFVLGIETDKETLEIAIPRLVNACPGDYKIVVPPNEENTQVVSYGKCFKVVNDNFRNILNIAKNVGLHEIDGILFDLGVNSPQLTSEVRGLSFQYPDAPLDMRLDRGIQAVTAADLLNGLREDQLAILFETVVESYVAKKFAKAIIKYRSYANYRTVSDLLESVKSVRVRSTKTHPATLAFMAVRIAVNSELEILPQALIDSFSLLKPGGTLVVISFHSGEDAIVKKVFKILESNRQAEVSNKPIVPSDSELEKNPRARSAKLRFAKKIQ